MLKKDTKIIKMKTKLLCLATIFALGFGGLIGYTTNYTDQVNANEMVLPRFVDVPRNTGFNIDINLNKNAVSLTNNPEQSVNIKIIKKDSIVYRTLIRNKVKPVIRFVRVPMPIHNRPISCIDVPKPNLDSILKVEKINLHRDQKSQHGINALMVYDRDN